MSALVELLVGIVGEIFLPESARVRLVLAGLIGLAFAGFVGWIVWDPLDRPDWSFYALACSVVYGSGGALASGTYLAIDGTERAAGRPFAFLRTRWRW